MKTSLTEQDILDSIESEQIYDLGKKTTAVVLTLKNGFEVVGISTCVDSANYKQEVGAEYARKRAIDKVWKLEGHVLQDKLKR